MDCGYFSISMFYKFIDYVYPIQGLDGLLSFLALLAKRWKDSSKHAQANI